MAAAETSAAPKARRAKRAAGDNLPAPKQRSAPPVAGPLDPEEGVAAFLEALDRGEPWYDALLAVIARWTAPDEDAVEGAPRSYLLGGEAFDWLSLAERLIAAAGDRVPEGQ